MAMLNYNTREIGSGEGPGAQVRPTSTSECGNRQVAAYNASGRFRWRSCNGG